MAKGSRPQHTSSTAVEARLPNRQSVQAKVCPRRTSCSFPGCGNRIQKGEVCYKHGAKAITCSHPGCSNNAVNKCVCRRHGATAKRCNYENCTNIAIKGGVCRRHGSLAQKCRHTGCPNNSKRHGLCRSHGAYRNQNLLAHDNPTTDSTSNQLTRDSSETHPVVTGTSNTNGEVVQHCNNVSPKIAVSEAENFDPLECSEMSSTLEILEHELSKILHDCGILRFDFHPVGIFEMSPTMLNPPEHELSKILLNDDISSSEYHPVEIHEMSPTLQNLEDELSQILRYGDILSFD